MHSAPGGLVRKRGRVDQQYRLVIAPLSIFGVFGAGTTNCNPFMWTTWPPPRWKRPGGQNEIINAIGPETFTYRELVETVEKVAGIEAIGGGPSARARLLGLPGGGSGWLGMSSSHGRKSEG